MGDENKYFTKMKPRPSTAPAPITKQKRPNQIPTQKSWDKILSDELQKKRTEELHRQQYSQMQKLFNEDLKPKQRNATLSKSFKRMNSNRDTFNPYDAQSIIGIFGITCTNAKL